MVAAAAIGGAVVGGVASSYSSRKAAGASKDAAETSAAVQQYMYDTSRRDLAPWRTTGESALNKLARLYGLESSDAVVTDPASAMLVDSTSGIPTVNQQLYESDPIYRAAWDSVMAKHLERFGVGYTHQSNAANIQRDVQAAMMADPRFRQRAAQGSVSSTTQGPDYSEFYNSPDYQFAYDEGLRATNAALAARGLANSGRALKELTRYGQGMASQQLNNYANRLASIAGVGQTATTNTAQLGANAAANIAGAYQNAGDARASAYLAQGNAINQGINNAFGTYALMNMMKGAA